MSDYAGDRTHMPNAQPTGLPEANKRKQQSQQPRQLLSCTKCRERKVKCDRTKPCSACCARGQPKDCQFVAEGGDYAPIQQSYELRKLRAENLRLKERLRASKISLEDEDSDFTTSPESQPGERSGPSQRRRTAKQKRFQGSEWQDSIYFGSPGLASVVNDFAAVNIIPTATSMAHLMPRGADMYTPKDQQPYPFPTLFPATPEECIPELLLCLPQREELFECLTGFEKRVIVCSFPHIPFEITRSEVERFLDDPRRNAQMCPDMLALIFAAIALGGQHSVWDRSGGQWEAEAMDFEDRKGKVYIAAAKQALRLSSYMHRPSLLAIQALLMIGPYLTNSGRFLDAWTLFGTTIRLAHSIGLHRHPKYLDPAPPTQRECSVRQTLWWWMLHMDEQYSMTLGRPLGISGIGDCTPPHELTTNPQMLRFSEFVNYFTVLARQILGSDRLTNARIDEFTDSIRALLDTMPEMLQFDSSWLSEETEIPDWPLSAMAAVYHCKAHTYLILLNRQRINKYTARSFTANIKTSPTGFRPVNRTPPSQPSPTITTNYPLRGRPLVLASSEDVLDAFLFFYFRVPAALISWTMAQQAFNSCMILLLDAIEIGSVTGGALKVEKAYVVFQSLQDVHTLASLAVERISWGLKRLHDLTQMLIDPPRPVDSHGGDAEMQRAWGEEAVRGPHPMCEESVMSATGMLLLEDPGLQGFVSEAFAPIAWNVGGPEPPTPFELKREREFSQGTGLLESPGSDEDTDEARSIGGMQGFRRSAAMRSVPTRYATPTVDDPQPPGVTTSALRTDTPRQTQQHHDPQATFPEGAHHFDHPPHLRHTQPFDECRSAWSYQSVATAPVDTKQPLYAGGFPALYQAPTTQMRHNSCPAIHQPTSVPSLARPPYSSPGALNVQPMRKRQPLPGPLGVSDQASFRDFLETIPQTRSPTASSNSQPLWSMKGTARPVALPIADAASNCLLPFHVGQTGLVQGHEHQTAFSYPSQFSETAQMMTPSGVEQMSMNEWSRWIGSSGAG